MESTVVELNNGDARLVIFFLIIFVVVFIRAFFISVLFFIVLFFLFLWKKIDYFLAFDVYQLKDVQRVKKNFLFKILLIAIKAMVCKAVIRYFLIEVAFYFK